MPLSKEQERAARRQADLSWSGFAMIGIALLLVLAFVLLMVWTGGR